MPSAGSLRRSGISLAVALLVATLPAAHAQLAWDEKVEFGAALYEIRGHLDALEINLGAASEAFTPESFMADTSRASFHAMHPIGEVYPSITGALRAVNTSADDDLRSALEALQARVDSGAASLADIAPEMAAARAATDAAQRATIGAVPSGDAALDAAIAAELLGVVGDEYDAAIVDGNVELIVELQDAYAFLNVAHMDLFRGQGYMEYPQAERAAIGEAFDGLYAHFAARADPVGAMEMTSSLASMIGFAQSAGSMMGDTMMSDSTMMMDDRGASRFEASAGRITTILGLLQEAKAAYEAGNAPEARGIVQNAYLYEFEFVERDLDDAGEPDLRASIETTLNERLLLALRANSPEVPSMIDSVTAELETARAALMSPGMEMETDDMAGTGMMGADMGPGHLAMAEKVGFGAALYEIRGHLDALEINLGAIPATFTPESFMADTSRASFHAMHPIGEVYPSITGALRAVNTSADDDLRSALEALQARVDSGAASLADIAPEMAAARAATDAAQRATIGAVPSGDAALDAAIAAELLGVVGDEYDAAIVDGNVELIVELQDAYAFLNVAHMDLFRGQGYMEYPQAERSAIDDEFGELYVVLDNRGDPARLTRMTAALADRVGSVLDGSMDRPDTPSPAAGPAGGCLIATAAYGTEMAAEVQALREIRDSTLLSTGAGAAFMSAFNDVYYSFSPTVADWERESPELRAAIRAIITPMVASLSIMSAAEPGSELDVAALGALVIALNAGLYVGAPAAIAWRLRR